MADVIVVGSLMMDLMARAPRLPLPGESLLGDTFGSFIGGKGCNQAIAARRMGSEVALIGRVGEDDFGRAFLAALVAEGVDHRHVSRDSETGTGVACVHIGAESGQNTIIATPRANLALTPALVEEALTELTTTAPRAQRPPIFLTQCETSLESVAAGLSRARALGMYTIFNVAPIPRAAIPAETYTQVDLLVVNETEASALSGLPVASSRDALAAADALLSLGPRAVLITLGERGSLFRGETPDLAGAVTFETAPYPVAAVDATGAGDAFCGFLAGALAENIPLREALQWASAAGSLTVTRMGAVPALPARAEVERVLAGERRPDV